MAVLIDMQGLMLEETIRRFDKKAIKHLRETHNLSYKEFAEKLKMSIESVMRWERNQSKPNSTTRSNIAKQYGDHILSDKFYKKYIPKEFR